MTVAEALDLKIVLTEEREDRLIRPLNYHQRTEHDIISGCSQVEKQLLDIEEYAHKN